jgi:hypothetical protein
MADEKKLPTLYLEDFEVELKVKPVFIGDSGSKEDTEARFEVEKNIDMIAKLIEPKIKHSIALLLVHSGVAKSIGGEETPPPDKMN